MSTTHKQQPDQPKRRRANKSEAPPCLSPEDYDRLLALAAVEGGDPQATLRRLLAEATPKVDTRPTLQLNFWMHAAGRAALEDLRRRHWHHVADVDLSCVGFVVLEAALASPEWVSARLNEAARYTRAEGVPQAEFSVSRILAALAARNATSPEESE